MKEDRKKDLTNLELKHIGKRDKGGLKGKTKTNRGWKGRLGKELKHVKVNTIED